MDAGYVRITGGGAVYLVIPNSVKARAAKHYGGGIFG